ncbi:Rrf2 family protein [Eggerthia catenaformis OT 569 = DSM 20559]|uniref:Rrf2 family protein n=1 Tax=Eggerthia catenaformis OT 569 = DSM 20559 TaxID=999415 RepID=M2NEH1_9FIRM|nr:Rrf2 family transcriptional regulator [Eggerthia catenaformis]EMD16608.1 Rrf2 family protein [Eggerthia catenaformis OT 569 = DSM 20559]OUC51207.1 Rrf2 family transcriptional regulator [Eggerthia catenaformis]
MMISSKGRYALRVMIDLAEHDPQRYIPLKEIAQRQNISEKYLEIIIKSLSKNHFVEGLRGKGGGYRLVRKPETYTIASILEISEGTLAPVSCLSDDSQTLPIWEGLYKVVKDYLENITLDELTEAGHIGNDYII